MPRQWEEALALIARVFHPPFADLWELDADDLRLWLNNVSWVLDLEKRRG